MWEVWLIVIVVARAPGNEALHDVSCPIYTMQVGMSALHFIIAMESPLKKYIIVLL